MINTKFKYKIKEIARKYNLPESVAEDIFNSQFKFFRQTSETLDLKNIETEREFDKLKTLFYFKYLGKIYFKWSKIRMIRNIINKKEINGEY